MDCQQDPAGEPDEFFFSLVVQLVPPMFIGFKEVVHYIFWVWNAFLFMEPDFLFREGRKKVRIFSGEVF